MRGVFRQHEIQYILSWFRRTEGNSLATELALYHQYDDDDDGMIISMMITESSEESLIEEVQNTLYISAYLTSVSALTQDDLSSSLKNIHLYSTATLSRELIRVFLRV